MELSHEMSTNESNVVKCKKEMPKSVERNFLMLIITNFQSLLDAIIFYAESI